MRVEFFGVPRERAGRASLDLEANTLGELLKALAAQIPSFSDFMCENRLQPALAANLNGDRFVSDPATPLNENDCVLILSADAGG